VVRALDALADDQVHDSRIPGIGVHTVERRFSWSIVL